MSREIFSVGDVPVPFRKMCENRQHLCGGGRSVEVYRQGEWRGKTGDQTAPRSCTRTNVQTEERAVELLDLCNMPEIQVIIGIEPDKQEDISDIKRILRPPVPVKAPPRIGRTTIAPVARERSTRSVARDERLPPDFSR